MQSENLYIYKYIYIYDRFHLSLGRHDALQLTRAEFLDVEHF